MDGSRSTHRIVGILAVTVVGAILLSACGSSSAATRDVVHVGPKDNGKTVHAQVGDTVEVVLTSTYWKMGPTSNTAVLAAHGAPTTVPSPGCVPGQGCGTVTATFHVVGKGTATVTASRVSCGEALRCTDGAGAFRITIVAA